MEVAKQIITLYSNRKHVEAGKMFGSETLKVHGSVFFVLMKDGIVFKLNAEGIEKALSIKGADYFDAHKNGKKMKEWIFIPEKAISLQCLGIAEDAFDHVKHIAKDKSNKKTKTSQRLK